jgi:hypothetical protein
VDPVPDPLLLRKSGSVGNRTRTSGSVIRNLDHWTTEAVARNIRCRDILQAYGEENLGRKMKGHLIAAPYICICYSKTKNVLM